MTIDKDRLRELASDPKNKAKDIRDALGFKNDAALHYQLNKDEEAKRIYADRASAKSAGDGKGKASARKPRRSSKQATTRATPPRNGRAKERISDDLLRRIKHEFEHISIYQQVSEFFDEVAGKVAAIK